MSSSDPQRPTPSGVDHVQIGLIFTREGPGAPESPDHQPPRVQSHPDQEPTIEHDSDRSQKSTGCVEDWLDIFCCCWLCTACF